MGSCLSARSSSSNVQEGMGSGVVSPSHSRLRRRYSCCDMYNKSLRAPDSRHFRRLVTKMRNSCRHQAMAEEVLVAEARDNEVLYRTAGRMCANASTTTSCIFTQQGRKGTNQDAMVVWENFTSHPETTFCGVFDGHGPFGHLVARKVRDSLPSKVSSSWKQAQARMPKPAPICVTPSSAELAPACDASLSAEEQQLKAVAVWKECFLKAYRLMDKELKAHPIIDCFCSGTTALTMLLQGPYLVIGNVGDSRAVLGTLTEENTLKAIQLSVDLKPNLPLEAERIKRCKGRVFALEDEPSVARVWLPYDNSPGLAMARALGDFCLKDFGLIGVPEMIHRRVSERDQFVVLASDGVWDVLSNEEVVEVIWTAPTRTTAARALVETALRAWRLKFPTSKVDDCAVVCLFLNDLSLPPAAAAAGAHYSCSGAFQKPQPPATVSGLSSFISSTKSSCELAQKSAPTLHQQLEATLNAFVIPKSASQATQNTSVPNLASIQYTSASGCTLDYAVANSSTRSAMILRQGDAIAGMSSVSGHDLPDLRDAQEGRGPSCEGAVAKEEAGEEMKVVEVAQEEEGEEITMVEIAQEGEGESEKRDAQAMERCASSRRSLAECLSSAAEEEEEWCALEGVARVNSLVRLPRFLLRRHAPH